MVANGRAALVDDPAGDLAAAVASLSAQHQTALRDLTGDRGESEAAPSRLACGLLKFPVDNDTTKLLCANFRPAAE